MLAESRRLRDGRPTAGLGRTLLHLGDAAAALGDTAEARRHWADAATVCEEARDADGQAAADARLVGGFAPAEEPSAYAPAAPPPGDHADTSTSTPPG
jgi:hypothetical protein